MGTKRRSRNSIIIKNGRVPIYIISALQKSVALGSTEAEYILLSEAARAIVWLRDLFEKLGVQREHTSVFEDNVGAIGCAKGRLPKNFVKRKHVVLRYNFVLLNVQGK